MVIGQQQPVPVEMPALELRVKELTEEVRQLEQAVRQSYQPRSSYGKSKADALWVALDLRGIGGRVTVEVWVKSSGAADFLVEGSVDGINFRPITTISLAAAGQKHEGFVNAYPVLRVRTDAANDNEIEVVASR
jgi:hypothetical protein